MWLIVLKKSKYFAFFSNIPQHWNSILKEACLYFSLYCVCWWPGSLHRQVISRNAIDVVHTKILFPTRKWLISIFCSKDISTVRVGPGVEVSHWGRHTSSPCQNRLGWGTWNHGCHSTFWKHRNRHYQNWRGDGMGCKGSCGSGMKMLRHQSLKLAWNLSIQNFIQVSQRANELMKTGSITTKPYLLDQDCSLSIANTLEILQSCT